MLNLNQVIVAGIIANDPELLTSNTGELYCRFNLGTKEDSIDEQGDYYERTNWHRCIVEGELAEEFVATCQKGSNVHIAGKMRSQFFDQGAGMMAEITEAVVAEFQIVSGGKEQPLDLDLILKESLEQSTQESEEQDVPY